MIVISRVSDFGLKQGEGYTVVSSDSKCYLVVLKSGLETWIAKTWFNEVK